MVVNRETEKELIEQDNQLNQEVLNAKRTFGALVKFVELLQTFCSVCYLSSLDECHKIKEAVGGQVYRRFGCGRRGQKNKNLRYITQMVIDLDIVLFGLHIVRCGC